MGTTCALLRKATAGVPWCACWLRVAADGSVQRHVMSWQATWADSAGEPS